MAEGKSMNLIDRDKIDIPRKRERLIDGLIYVPLADVVKGLDDAPTILDEKDMATITEALERQVRLPVERELLDDESDERILRLKGATLCPACKTELKQRSAHCPDCGQALDWEEAD